MPLFRVSEEKQREKAKLHVAKAEQLMDHGKSAQAAEEFQKAADIFFELEEWKIAEQCYFYASKNLNTLEKFYSAANLQRLAADCCLNLNEFAKARDYFDVSTKSVLKSDVKNRENLAAITITLAFFCHFVENQPDQAIDYVKRFKSQLDPDLFTHDNLIQLARNLSNAVYNEDESYFKKIIADYPKLNLNSAEMNLIRAGINVSMASVFTKFNLENVKTEFVMDQLITVPAYLDLHRMKEITTHSVLPYKLSFLTIKEISITVGDNLSVKERPVLPMKIDLPTDNLVKIPIMFRTNFPGKGSIGPYQITLDIDQKYQFSKKTAQFPINIVSPLAKLDVVYEALKTPVINQTFPLQVTISNISDGEAVQLEIEMEFPENLRIIRGTLKKSLYALRPNEQFKFEILVKAMEPGDLPVTTTIHFRDPDGKDKEPIVKKIPVQINL